MPFISQCYFFGSCIIHILHTGVLKFKYKTPVPKGYTKLISVSRLQYLNLSTLTQKLQIYQRIITSKLQIERKR